ncbi:hypothetical protein [Spirosoma koreense]
MKLTVKNIVDLWFSADTPIRQFKVKLHPDIWAACEKTNQHFKAPSGIKQVERYRKSDKVAFAENVLKELTQEKVPNESDAYDLV